MHRVDDCFKQRKSLGRKSDTSADHNACIVCGSQVTFHCLPSRLIRTDEADIGFPSPVSHLLQRERNTGIYLLGAHAWRQSGIGEINRVGVEAHQHNSRHHFPFLKSLRLPQATLS